MLFSMHCGLPHLCAFAGCESTKTSEVNPIELRWQAYGCDRLAVGF